MGSDICTTFNYLLLYTQVDMIAACLLVIILSIFIYFIYSWKKLCNYWTARGVPCEKPELIFGNYKKYLLLQEMVGKVSMDICKRFPDAPYIGTYYGTKPALLVKDPDLIKLIMTKDYYYFNSREIAEYTPQEIPTQSLFFTYGDRWKVMRQNLTPLFSSAKTKNMFYLIQKCLVTFEKLLAEEAEESSVEIRRLMARFTMDCICSCCFGVDTNTMDRTVKNNPFRVMGDMLFDSSTKTGIKQYSRAIWPSIFYTLRFKLFPTEIDKFFGKLMKDVFDSRDHKPTSRQDFVDMILNFKSSDSITGDCISNMKTGRNDKASVKVNDVFLTSQCIGIFAAGYETSAGTLGYTLYELAKNVDKQTKVIEEVDEYTKKHAGKVEYDCVNDLPYLDACVMEALRLYPVLSNLTREVYEEYKLPDGLVLEKGLRIHLPIYYLHHNPEYFPEPEAFRPERFLAKDDTIKPYTYISFGEGPRICIGMRFAKMQMLAGLVTLFKSYRVEMTPETPREVRFEPRSFVTQAIGDIPLKLVPRHDVSK